MPSCTPRRLVDLRHNVPAAFVAICLAAIGDPRVALGVTDEHGNAARSTETFSVGLYPQEVAEHFTTANGLPANQTSQIDLDEAGNVWVATAAGAALKRPGAARWEAATMPPAETLSKGRYRVSDSAGAMHQSVRHNGQIYCATDDGLVTWHNGKPEPCVVQDETGRRWDTARVRGVTVDSKQQLWFTTEAGVACQTTDGWRFYTGDDGLPYNHFTVAQAGSNGIVWFGTERGAIAWHQNRWVYRQGRRWLPDDHINDIVVDANGDAWFATPGGVGRIGHRPMTLADKAEHYELEIEKYIKRTPFGYLSEVGLSRPGDRSSEILYHDSDNDGLWTSMYGAGECFAYGATKSADAKRRAKQAFEALRFLQKVTQGGEHSPPHGYVARTIRSVDLPDPNEGRVEHDRQMRQDRDGLWKIYEPRWPKSADGKWYWKSDTSSDELDGHYFFYPAYYDLVADTDEERERVREVVRDLTDHLIAHDYNLVDHDGTPTRWGIYGPNSLNHDAAWWSERGLKSLSMLSYLSVAHHMTGDSKYQEHIDSLTADHAYETNAMIYKIHRGPGSGNQSDDEMAFMCYYNLLKYCQDDDLRRRILLSFYNAWVVEQPEMNPFFHFAYAAHGLGATYRDQWGEHRLSPWDGWLEDSVATLTGFPLDRLNWSCTNSHRLDIMRLHRHTGVDATDSPRRNRGMLNNGKVLPVENRYFHHWNTDPWQLNYGGNGQSLASGTVFLLPYYMGLYHGFLD